MQVQEAATLWTPTSFENAQNQKADGKQGHGVSKKKRGATIFEWDIIALAQIDQDENAIEEQFVGS